MRSFPEDGGSRPLYFDNQASTRVDPLVFAAMQPFFSEEFGNPHSAEHVFGRTAQEAIEGARDRIARCINCDAQDLIFTSGATEANNLAILGVAHHRAGGRGTILVSPIEHSSVLESARASELRIVTVDVDGQGVLDLQCLKRHLSDDVLLVSIGFVNNEVGTIQDVRAIGELVHAAGALFHVDAAQALTAVQIDLHDSAVDYLSLSSHKAYGPKGVGALYVAPGRRQHLKPLIFGGGQEHGLRAGTLPTPLCVGFGAACALIHERGEMDRMHVQSRRDQLLDRLRSLIPQLELVGSVRIRHPGNLSVKLPVEDARDIVQLLQGKLACSTGSACHSGLDTPSHVLLGMGLSTLQARKVLRLGIGRFTSDQECNVAAEMLASAIEQAMHHNQESHHLGSTIGAEYP